MPPEERTGGRDWDAAMELLRRRGYLGGKDGGERRPPRRLRRWMELGGLLLALACGVALAALAPSSPAAVLVGGGLLAVPLGLALAVVMLVSGAALEFAHRSGVGGEKAVLVHGVVVGFAVAGLWLYLTGGAPLPRSHPARLAGAALALLAAAGLSRWATLFLAARLLRRAPQLRFRLPRGAWALAAASLVVVLGLTIPQERGPDSCATEPLRVRPHPVHLAILGVDGLPEDDFRLVAREQNLAPVAWCGAALESGSPGTSIPVRWVTVATGADPAEHGVTSLRRVTLPAGAPPVLAAEGLRRILSFWRFLGLVEERAVPSAQRKIPSVWEMVSRAGMAVRVAGWWGSFPPRRVTGLVASERWLFTGRAEPGTVSPPGAAAGLPRVPGNSPLAMDRRAAQMLDGAEPEDESLAMGYFPGWWLEHRKAEGGPLQVAEALRPHVELVCRTADRLWRRGWTVWLVAVDGRGGGWVLSSAALRQGRPVLDRELAPTWLDQMGLPVPAGALSPRRELSAVPSGAPLVRVEYGGPPALAEAAPREEGEAQLELIRSLGYLR